MTTEIKTCEACGQKIREYKVGDIRKKTVCPCCFVYEAGIREKIKGDSMKVSFTLWSLLKENISKTYRLLVRRQNSKPII